MSGAQAPDGKWHWNHHSVLCPGRPSDSTSQAILFQNFQVRYLASKDADPRRRYFALVKAGFLLSENIRSSTIVLGDGLTTVNMTLFLEGKAEKAGSNEVPFSAL